MQTLPLNICAYADACVNTKEQKRNSSPDPATMAAHGIIRFTKHIQNQMAFVYKNLPCECTSRLVATRTQAGPHSIRKKKRRGGFRPRKLRGQLRKKNVKQWGLEGSRLA